MLTAKLAHVEKEMLENEWCIYRIYDGKNLVAGNESKDLAPVEAVERMREDLRNFDGGYVRIVISKQNGKENAEGGNVREKREFNVRVDEKQSSGVQGIGEFKSLAEENLKLKEQIIRSEYQKQIDNVMLELNSLRQLMNDEPGEEDEDEDENIKGMGKVVEFVKEIKSLINPPATNNTIRAISGPVDDAKITNAIERLKKLDGNIDEHLCELATLAEKNIGTYNNAIEKLKVALTLV